MRVTNNMMTSNLLYNVNKNLEYMSKRQEELSSGKRINSPSDDPVLASKILARRTDLAELEQYDKNTRDALGWLEITEKAIEDNGIILQRMRELTVQAANGSNTALDTQKIKLEVSSLKEQLISNANSTFAGRYIFSGFETNEKFLKADGTFNIDMNKYSLDNKPVVKYEVGVGESIDVMTSGIDLYGYVEDSNIMTTGFTDVLVSGTASSYSVLTGYLDRSLDHSASDLDIDINGTIYNVNESLLVGPPTFLNKAQVTEVYENANDGLGNLLKSVADVTFDVDGNIVVTSKVAGAVLMTPQSALTHFSAGAGGTNITGIDVVEVSVSSATYGDPTLPLTQSQIDVLTNESLKIDLNGTTTEKLLPRDSAIISNLNDYVAEMNVVFDNQYGAGKLLMTVDLVGIITIASQNTEAELEPSLKVAFPKLATGFPSGKNDGLSATKSSLTGSIDFSADYTVVDLSLDIAGTVYTVDSTTLDGIITGFSKEDIIAAYELADDGGGNLLGDISNIFFNADDKLVIEMDVYGVTLMTPQTAATYFDVANGGIVYAGIATLEASISGIPLGDPTLAMLQTDIDTIRGNSLNIIVNSISKSIAPSPSATITNLNEYVAEMNNQLDKEFGVGNVLMSVDLTGVITVATFGSTDGETPSITVDFERSNNSELLTDIDKLLGFLEDGNHSELSKMLSTVDGHVNNMLALRADIGARSNRMELITKRIASNNISFTQMLSDAQDVDMAEAIMLLKNAENVYQASLSTGARIIQPSLIDFLR